jgi:uncharacterized protein
MKIDHIETLAAKRFQILIKEKTFPCVGAKSALAQGQMQFYQAGNIWCSRDDVGIHYALKHFVKTYRYSPNLFQSLVVIFDGPHDLDEATFETALWSRLQALNDIDANEGFGHDQRVSSDPKAADFALSFAEEAFFAVGLHPNSSRQARYFDSPVMVFNPHSQFEQLRSEGIYETLRDNIIKRDVAFSGSVNPMLSRHNQGSQARQYSGQSVTDDWVCPFSPRDANDN